MEINFEYLIKIHMSGDTIVAIISTVGVVLLFGIWYYFEHRGWKKKQLKKLKNK